MKNKISNVHEKDLIINNLKEENSEIIKDKENLIKKLDNSSKE